MEPGAAGFVSGVIFTSAVWLMIIVTITAPKISVVLLKAWRTIQREW